MSLNESIEKLLNEPASMTLEQQNEVLRDWVRHLMQQNARLEAEVEKSKQLAALLRHFSNT